MAFSILYDARKQSEFGLALEEGRLRDATMLLQRLPHGVNDEENRDRLTVMMEGYRVIAERMPEGYLLYREGVEELERYRRLGSVNDLKSSLDELERFQDLGTVEELSDTVRGYESYREVTGGKDSTELGYDLEELKQYRELGDIETLEQNSRWLDRL